MSRSFRLLFVIGAATVAFGAFVYFGYRPVAPTSFVRQWTAAIENVLVMQPVYPLREDVEVGDIYLSIAQSDAGTRVVPPRRIGHLDSRVMLQQSATSRLELRPGAVSKQPTANSGAQPALARLRQVAIPGFKIVRTDERASLGQASSTLFGVKLGSRSDNSSTISVSLSSVQELAAPDDNVMLDSIVEFCKSPGGKSVFDQDRIRFLLGQMIDVTGQGDIQSVRSSIVVVSRVLYAGAIDMALSDATSLSGLSKGKGEPKELAGTNDKPKTGGTGSVGEGASTEGVAVEAKALGASLGISANLSVVGQQSLALRQTFDVPMAFAFGGISVKALGDGALKNCEFIKARAGGISGRFLSGRDD